MSETFTEKWESLASIGYPGYVVSTYGRVRGPRGELKLQRSPKGYMQCRPYGSGSSRLQLIHRLVALVFIPNPERLPQVNHKDGNKKNCFVNNLEWCTAKYNVQDAADNGLITYHRGSEHHKARLTEDQVLEIRRVYTPYSNKYGSVALARKYGVSQGRISAIATGNAWKHMNKY